MEENDQYLVAVHDLEEALNKDLHNSVIGHNQKEHLTDDHIKDILVVLRSATDRFMKAEAGIKQAVEPKSLEKIRDTVSIELTPVTLHQETNKYAKIYPLLSPASSQTEAHDGHPVRQADMGLQTKLMLSKFKRIHQQKNRLLALERIEASIKKNMKRL